MSATAVLDAAPARPGRRLWLMLSVPVLLVAGGLGYWLTSGRYESTDNAALHDVRISVVSDLTGRVVSSSVTDGAQVKLGDVLFQIDPKPYKIPDPHYHQSHSNRIKYATECHLPYKYEYQCHHQQSFQYQSHGKLPLHRYLHCKYHYLRQQHLHLRRRYQSL